MCRRDSNYEMNDTEKEIISRCKRKRNSKTIRILATGLSVSIIGCLYKAKANTIMQWALLCKFIMFILLTD